MDKPKQEQKCAPASVFWIGLVRILYKAVITASGHGKESAHDKHRIFCPVTVNDRIFCPGSHFLPVVCRKSRTNSEPYND